ncbi:hypothetical protein JTB14_037509 [Gonioctena quinquepunctata]|nr:hypothetical protein JTB14_037509 [Gonioctena quinquepunctata]
MLWHKRLGHLNHFSMKLLKDGLATGMTYKEKEKPEICESCIKVNKFEDTPESTKITASFPLSGEDEDSVETRSESTIEHPEPRAEDPIEEENSDVREESESGSENSECIEEETSVEESEDASRYPKRDIRRPKYYDDYVLDDISGGPISWESHKQKVTALSSTEAEYIGICEAAKESLYLKSLC